MKYPTNVSELLNLLDQYIAELDNLSKQLSAMCEYSKSRIEQWHAKNGSNHS